MIEIIDGARQSETANSSSKVVKIESIVRAWAKIEADDGLTEDQKNLVTRTVMSQIWRIMEGVE